MLISHIFPGFYSKKTTFFYFSMHVQPSDQSRLNGKAIYNLKHLLIIAMDKTK